MRGLDDHQWSVLTSADLVWAGPLFPRNMFVELGQPIATTGSLPSIAIHFSVLITHLPPLHTGHPVNSTALHCDQHYRGVKSEEV